MKTLIAVPTTGSIDYRAIGSLLRLDRASTDEIMLIPRMQIYQARNLAVKQAIEGDYDYLVFIDDDMIVPENFLNQMMMESRDIYCALSVDRKGENQIKVFKQVPYIDKTMTFRYEHIPNEELGEGVVEIGATGMACTGIKRQVFKDVYERYLGACFEFRNEVVGSTKLHLSEDLDFCDKAKRLGYRIWVDTELITGHIGIGPVYFKK